MDKKRKNAHRSCGKLFCLKSLMIFCSFLFFIVFAFSDHDLSQNLVFKTSLKSLRRSSIPGLLPHESFDIKRRRLIVEDRILQPDHLLLLLSDRIPANEQLECVYYRLDDDKAEPLLLKQAISVDDYQDDKSIVRCQLPPENYSAAADLRRPDEELERSNQTAAAPLRNRLVYEAVLDWNTVVVFAKGLGLIPHRESDAGKLSCHFGSNNSEKDNFPVITEATAAAQEVVRCLLPRSLKNLSDNVEEIRVSVGRIDDPGGVSDAPLPSAAKIYRFKQTMKTEKYELCACTMVWNQAAFLREWIMYHAWLGVERWFIYDNNSEDAIQDAIDELNLQDYNVSRHVWPWIKSQEAGFSHCALRSRRECKWVGFFDVDEFFYLPHYTETDLSARNSLRSLVANYSNSPTYAEIRTICRSFGPSKLTAPPMQGVSVGYTCRLQAPERYKSIVRPELLDTTLLNAVYFFRLREGYKPLSMPETVLVMNHYKYQVWDVYKEKYFGRVSTYVVNWQEDHRKNSKDRAPGLGPEAIEPPRWSERFCEVWDVKLKEFVMANFADPETGFLPWEKSLDSLL